MRTARARGEDRTDWTRVRREIAKDPDAAAQNRAIGELIAKMEARKRGRPVVGEAKTAVSLRVPDSVLARWRASGKGWQTRAAAVLAAHAPPPAGIEKRLESRANTGFVFRKLNKRPQRCPQMIVLSWCVMVALGTMGGPEAGLL
jgi:uncharacterized protein (DUF4415 family)